MEYIKSSIQSIIEFLTGFKNMINDLGTKGKRRKQIPNLLTLSRIGFALIIPPLAISGSLIPAAILTICAALTDALDGLAARKLNAISEFGKNLDPVCDKIFAGALLIPLIGKVSPLLSFGLGANILLELGIAGVNLKSKVKGNVPRTTILGKVKTATLSALIASLYLSFTYKTIISIIPFIYALTTIIQTITLINYKQIDKKKDMKKAELKKICSPSSEIINSSCFNKNVNKRVIDYFLSKKYRQSSNNNCSKAIIKLPYDSSIYSVDDYKSLKEEVIRTKSIPTTQTELFEGKNNEGFQKIK